VNFHRRSDHLENSPEGEVLLGTVELRGIRQLASGLASELANELARIEVDSWQLVAKKLGLIFKQPTYVGIDLID
jgi:hypothetical protein